MGADARHPIISRGTLLPVLVALCAVAGCWEEVHYVESDSAPSPAAGSPAEQSDALAESVLVDADRAPLPLAEADDEAERFADDLARSLPDEQQPADEAPAPATDDRYAVPDDSAPADDSLSDLFGGGQPATDDVVTAEDAAPSASSAPPAGSPAADDGHGLFDDPSPVSESPTVDDLFGPPPATAEPAAPPVASPPRPNPRRLTWLLGSKLSLSVLARDRGAPDEEVAKWFSQSRVLADALGLSLVELPEPTRAGNAAVDYLFRQGQRLGRDLTDRYGADHAALFELAVKSNILLVLYKPDASDVDAMSLAIGQSCTRSGLPSALCEPLLLALRRRAPLAEVSQAVFGLHDQVDGFLAAPPP